ncbi:MAG: SurA N-terminal domain-containing protein, partial [Burkholderiaceae bacterium]|nr:SurA N-terminal domain-containing protein [Burkholderiaceae bacterium]
MLQSFRTHKRLMMGVAMIFIVPSFVVTGIYSYNRMTADEALAEVGGDSITVVDFDNAKRQHLDKLRRQLGTNFNPNMLDGQQARADILAGLITERALGIEMAKDYVMVSEADAINLVKSAPNFQRDGKFSREAYEQFLHAVGKSDQLFVMELRRDMARDLLLGGAANSAIVPTALAQRVHEMMSEERVVRMATISPADFAKLVTVTDDEARAFYDANKSLFVVPESVDIEYVTLSPANFMDIKPSEDEVKGFYEQNLKRFTTPEQRRASHILVADKEQADKLFAELQAKPALFAERAKELSKDPGSAKNGGDLGFFGKGMMVPEFETAVFTGKKGDLVAPVKTNFGYHIIRIDDVQAAQVKPLASVRGEIEALYAQQASMQAFAAEAENFSNMVYEQSDSLEPVATKFNLKPQTVKNVTRDFKDQTINGNVVEALYSFDVLSDKRNTNSIEIAHNTLLSARVTAHHPETTQTFEAVKDQIVARLTNDKAAKAAEEAGQKTVAHLKAGEKNTLKFGEAVSLSRQNPGEHSYDIVAAAMKPQATTLPAFTGVMTPNGYVVVEVLNSNIPEAG